jgi:hypothetical protein
MAQPTMFRLVSDIVRAKLPNAEFTLPKVSFLAPHFSMHMGPSCTGFDC